MKPVPRVVVVLGTASLLTDLSSEMIYPLLPLFLTATLGAGPAALGLIEGVAESTAALFKVLSGRLSDRRGRRKPFVVAGYGLSGTVRPLIGLAGAWPVVLLLRFLDRVGKGLRTSPRDAIIAGAVEPEIRGRAYGLHRAMDHAGAVLGPLVAAALLLWAGLSLRTVILLAAIPGVAVIAVLVLGVREPASGAAKEGAPRAGRWSDLPPEFRRLLAALVVFTLGNSTDAFLLLRLGDLGFSAGAVAVLWSAHHVVKMVGNRYLGALADRAGRRPLLLAGWGIYAAVYGLFALGGPAWWMAAVFLLYGLYYGFAEPVERAWVADLAPANLRGTAFGLYHGAVGIAALPASLLFGGLWSLAGAPAAFLAGAGLSLVAALLLLRVSSPRGVIG